MFDPVGLTVYMFSLTKLAIRLILNSFDRVQIKKSLKLTISVAESRSTCLPAGRFR